MGKISRIERKAKKRKFGIIFFLLLFIIVLFLFISLKTDFFKIDKVEISGNKKTPNEKILKVSGNIENENIFKLNLKTIRKNIEAMPYVKEVEVKRKLPNRIIIKVEEREKKIKMAYVGSIIYIDEEGYILSIGDEKDNNNCPELIGPEIKKPELGENVFTSHKSFENLKDLIKLSESINIYKEFDKIDIRKKDNIVVQLRTGTKIIFGDFSDLKYKLSFLNSIIKDMNKKKINYQYIYLNKGENPVIVTESD